MPNARTQDWSLALFLCPSWGRKAMDSRLHRCTTTFCTYTLQSNGTCSRPFLAISLLVSRLG
jgi:hypothetical protein